MDWIKTTKRMPNDEEEVLIVDGLCRITIASWSEKYKTWHEGLDSLSIEPDRVAYWMPLPPLPE